MESPLEAKNDAEIIHIIAKKMRIFIPEFEYSIKQSLVELPVGNFNGHNFANFTSDIYCKCSISRNSKTMLECEKQLNS